MKAKAKRNQAIESTLNVLYNEYVAERKENAMTWQNDPVGGESFENYVHRQDDEYVVELLGYNADTYQGDAFDMTAIDDLAEVRNSAITHHISVLKKVCKQFQDLHVAYRVINQMLESGADRMIYRDAACLSLNDSDICTMAHALVDSVASSSNRFSFHKTSNAPEWVCFDKGQESVLQLTDDAQNEVYYITYF